MDEDAHSQIVNENNNEATLIEGLDATPEELAGAATKISAVFRGKKARE